MSAISQPPSDQLLKLKLFLEKTKTDFIAQNPDLLDWMKDRKLEVDHLTFVQETQTKQPQQIESVQKDHIQKISTIKNTDTPLASTISQEEYESIIEKIIELLRLPAGQLEEDSELYLEQQLSDILGFDVSVNLDEHKLLFSTGIMKALPHLKRSPTDSLNKHTNFHEADINQNRSAFGWFCPSSELSQEAIDQEKYYISIPLYYHLDWSSNFSELKKWYKFRKAVVVNPNERVAVVCSIADIGPTTYNRHQFGGSPELIISGKIWSPNSAGHVLILFVDDPTNAVPYGPVHLDTIVKGS